MTQRLPSASEIERLLAHYNWKEATWRPVHIGGNYVVKIELPLGKCFALRLSPSTSNIEKLNREIDWLDRLRAAGFEKVPRPVLNAWQKPITILDDDFGSFGSFCVAFEWINGTPLIEVASRDAAIEVGSILAKLHKTSERIIAGANGLPNCNIEENSSDDKWLENLDPFWETSKRLTLSEQQKKIIENAVAYACDHLRRVRPDISSYGSIHGDMNARNAIVEPSNAISIIDFEETRAGFYGTDVAALALHLSRLKYGEELSRLFVNSYRSHRDHVVDGVGGLSAFKILNLMRFLYWLNNGCHESKLGDSLAVVPWALDNLKQASEV